MPRPSPITLEQRAEATRMYKSGVSRNAVARIFKASRAFVSDMLADQGIKTRTISEVCRTVLPKGNVFERAEENEEAAYWIGFLMADGCISCHSKGSKYVIFQIADSDGNHLERFRDFVGVTGSMSTVAKKDWVWYRGERRRMNCQACRRFCFASHEIADTLIAYGVTPRKSKTAQVSNSLSMNRHFWRGFCDGDGCLGFETLRNQKKRRERIQFVGSQYIIRQLSTFIKHHIATNAKAYPGKRKDGWYFVTAAKKAWQIVSLLYSNANVGLPRKMAIASEILAMRDPVSLSRID